MNSCGRSSGSCRNEAPLDLAIEWRGAVFDLSNLVSKSVVVVKSASSLQGSLYSLSWKIRKPRELKRLYPTERMLQYTEDACSKDTLGKGKHRLSHPALFDQRSSFTRRTKTGASTSFSTRDYSMEMLGPGAYEFIPEDEHANLKPAPKLEISKPRKNPPFENNQADAVHYPDYGALPFDKYSSMRGPEFEPISPAPRAKTDLQIEISPGVFARLRGSEETWNAIKSGNSTHTKCFSCELSLLCISDAEYVICPACRVVSPITMRNHYQGKQSHHLLHPLPALSGGVGLGMQAY